MSERTAIVERSGQHPGNEVALACVCGDKADIDTSPRVFASAHGNWVRVTTKREWGDDEWKWTTSMALSHAEGGGKGYADDKVVSEITLDNFPDRILISRKGDLIVLGHFSRGTPLRRRVEEPRR